LTWPLWVLRYLKQVVEIHGGKKWNKISWLKICDDYLPLIIAKYKLNLRKKPPNWRKSITTRPYKRQLKVLKDTIKSPKRYYILICLKFYTNNLYKILRSSIFHSIEEERYFSAVRLLNKDIITFSSQWYCS